jgi:hypothetical protein
VVINPKYHWIVPAKLISKTRSPLEEGVSSFEEAGGLAGTRVQGFLPFDWSVLQGSNCILCGACGMSSMKQIVIRGQVRERHWVQSAKQERACTRE